MSRYDQFAPEYDIVVGSRAEAASYIMGLIRRYHPRAKSLLELGCGSGSILKHLSTRFETVGIDSSRSMLALAKKKAPKSKLILGDITQFNLERKFDVIIAPFDTINHVTSLSGWRRVFENARQHLNKGGVFIFDVNTECKMEGYRVSPEVTELRDDLISIIEVKRTRKYRYEVIQRLFKRRSRDTFALKMMVLPELIVPTPVILKELSAYFRRVTMIDPEQSKPNDFTEELFFVCGSPRSSL